MRVGRGKARAGQGGGGGWAAQHSTEGQGGRGVKSTSPNTPEPEDVKATFCPAIHSFEVKRRADVYLPIPVSGRIPGPVFLPRHSRRGREKIDHSFCLIVPYAAMKSRGSVSTSPYSAWT